MEILVIGIVWLSSLLFAIMQFNKYGASAMLILLGAIFFSWLGVLVGWGIVVALHGTKTGSNDLPIQAPAQVTVIKVRCPSCNNTQVETAKFCANCGLSFTNVG